MFIQSIKMMFVAIYPLLIAIYPLLVGTKQTEPPSHFHDKEQAIWSLIICNLYLREDQNIILKSSEDDEISGDRQEEPTNLKDNPAYLSVSNTPQFTMSADAVYSTVDESDLQTIPRHNSANFSLEMSVASF